jgi:hypothetical protein
MLRATHGCLLSGISFSAIALKSMIGPLLLWSGTKSHQMHKASEQKQGKADASS